MQGGQDVITLIRSCPIQDTSAPSIHHTRQVMPTSEPSTNCIPVDRSEVRSIVLGVTPVLLQDCLRRLIEDSGFAVVACTENGTHVVSAALTLRPDVVMTTMTLAPFGGLDVITSIGHTRADIPVVAVIDTASAHDAERALRAGATSCLYLDDTFEHCRHVLQRAAIGDVVMTRRVVKRAMQHHRATLLSRREEQVLNLVARGRSVNQIASDMVISPKTVKHHLSATYSKLGVHNRTDAVVAAFRHGIVDVHHDIVDV